METNSINSKKFLAAFTLALLALIASILIMSEAESIVISISSKALGIGLLSAICCVANKDYQSSQSGNTEK